MRNMTRVSIALFAVICGFQILPANAATSGDLRPIKGQTMVYQGYIDTSNNYQNCKQVSDDTVQLSGGATVFVGAQTWPSAYPKEMNLQCEKDYVMVTMNQHTTGGLSTLAVAGGQISNNGKAICCPLKHRWAPTQTA